MQKREKYLSKRELFSRRNFLRDFSVSAGMNAGCFLPFFSGCYRGNNISAKSNNSEVLDEALILMSDVAPLGNHGPMAAEALIALGRKDKVIPFVESFKRSFAKDYPPKLEKINLNNWKNALGSGKRVSDWIEFFENLLKEKGWNEVVKVWVGNLAPGLSAAAAHGLIRTGHAVRSLSRKTTETRKKELAQALGYWAAHYTVLPQSDEQKNLKLELSEAVREIPILPGENFDQRSSIMGDLLNLLIFRNLKSYKAYGV